MTHCIIKAFDPGDEEGSPSHDGSRGDQGRSVGARWTSTRTKTFETG